MHVCPYQNATRGELAVYCLHIVLRKNWYDLTPEYRAAFDRDKRNDQEKLRTHLATAAGTTAMMAAWRAHAKKT